MAHGAAARMAQGENYYPTEIHPRIFLTGAR
jgi:hypothetical protein